MKVCLLTRFFDLRNAGIGRFSMELRDKLRQRGHEVLCVADPGDYTGPEYLAYTSWKIRSLIPRDADVYHCASPMESLYVPKDRAVVTIHDLIPWLHSKGLNTHYTGDGVRGEINRLISLHWFRRGVLSAAKARFVVTDAQAIAQEVRNCVGVNAWTIRPGISPGLAPGPRTDRTFRVGTLSYLDRRKRIDLLIRAFLEADINGELAIGGKGVDEPMLKALAGGDPRIKFAGFVPEDKLAEFYNSLDLFVFPSKIEGYGLPIVEAMACGKTVVVLDDSEIPSDVRDRCLVSRDLADTLVIESHFFRNGKLSDAQAENLKFASAHSWDRCAAEYEGLYKLVA
jgi:glycosyltransferase involved in cell wall biosynthesis